MAQGNGFIKEVLIRKIPQIIGMYIASVWLAVEISDWMSGRFDMPTQFSTYVFVGMMVMLPSAVLIAWGHGRPGRDQWSMIEKIFLPVNLIIALLALVVFVKLPIQNLPVNTMQATANPIADNAMQQMAVIDAVTGKEVIYEVAKQAYHQTVVSFFWDNKTGDKALDWMSYGASWLLSQDLKRTPVISTITPYDSADLFHQLKDKGFKRAVNIPFSLARKIAESKSIKWMISGNIDKENEHIIFSAKLFDVKTGEMLKSISSDDKDWLNAIDTIANGLSEFILSSTKVHSNIIPQLAIAEHTSNNLEAIKSMIAALNSVTFDNDFNLALEQVRKAIDFDSSFADAHVFAMQIHRGLGDIPHAIEQATKALDYDYKLYQESVFFVKASLFSMQNGNIDKAIKVLENWVKIYPHSAEALSILGRSYINVGNHQEEAKEVFKRLYKIEGSGNSALINLGKIYRLQNNKQKSLEYLTKYLAANPTKSSAYFELAAAYKQFGMLDKAKEMYEEASLYDNRNFKADIGLANIIAAQGNYQKAISLLKALSNKSKTDNQKVEIMTSILEIYRLTGQMRKAIDLTEELKIPAKKSMSPVSFVFQVEGAKILYYTDVGEFAEAQKVAEDIRQSITPPLDELVVSFEKYIYSQALKKDKFAQATLHLEELATSLGMFTLKPDILASKAKIAYWNKDYSQAIELYDKAIDLTSQSFITLLTTAQIDWFTHDKAQTLFKLKKYQEALDLLDVVIMRTPLFGQAYVLKAQIYNEIKELENRDKAIQKVRQVWKDADEDFLDYKDFIAFTNKYE